MEQREPAEDLVRAAGQALEMGPGVPLVGGLAEQAPVESTSVSTPRTSRPGRPPATARALRSAFPCTTLRGVPVGALLDVGRA